MILGKMLLSSVEDNVGYPKNGEVQKIKGRLSQKSKKSTTHRRLSKHVTNNIKYFYYPHLTFSEKKVLRIEKKYHFQCPNN